VAAAGKQMSARKPIKVLIVAPAAPLVGGQAVQARRLVEKFRGEPDLQVDLQPVNPEFLPALQKIKYVRTVLTTAKYLFDLLFKIPRYDVIHIFSASYFSFLLAPAPAVLIAKIFGKKTILNYRSGEAEDHLARWRSALPIIRLFDEIVVPSGYLVDVFARFGLRAETIFNFVDAEKYRFRRREFLQPVFLSNRNFEPLYNVECVLRAFAEIQKKCSAAKLIVAGDGAERERLRKLAQELKLKNVEFLGRVAPEEMPALYDRADIYLNAPDIDNMPNSVIEAFAAGTPVVSTDAGGIPYIVENGKTGILTARNDYKAIAERAVFLLENPAKAQEIVNNARRELEKYSWQSAREKWLALYENLSK
jgi:L-malate glycosyltransferase